MRPSRRFSRAGSSDRRPLKRPASYVRAGYVASPLSSASFFYRCHGEWADLVARPRFPGEHVPGLRMPWVYWDAMGPTERMELAMSLRKPSRPSANADAVLRPDDPSAREDMPTLYAYLTDDKWEDGSNRQRSTLIVFCDDDMFKMCLTDKDSDLTLWVASKTFLGLWGAMEARLNDPEADWRKRRGPGTAPKKKG